MSEKTQQSTIDVNKYCINTNVRWECYYVWRIYLDVYHKKNQLPVRVGKQTIHWRILILSMGNGQQFSTCFSWHLDRPLNYRAWSFNNQHGLIILGSWLFNKPTKRKVVKVSLLNIMIHVSHSDTSGKYRISKKKPTPRCIKRLYGLFAYVKGQNPKPTGVLETKAARGGILRNSVSHYKDLY